MGLTHARPNKTALARPTLLYVRTARPIIAQRESLGTRLAFHFYDCTDGAGMAASAEEFAQLKKIMQELRRGQLDLTLRLEVCFSLSCNDHYQACWKISQNKNPHYFSWGHEKKLKSQIICTGLPDCACARGKGRGREGSGQTRQVFETQDRMLSRPQNWQLLLQGM